MYLSYEQLIGLPVATRSGEPLGKVEGCGIDTDTHLVFQYQVKPSGIANMFAKELLIGREQVVSLDNTKMVVKDADYEVHADTRQARIKKAPLPTGAEPITWSAD